METFFTSLDNQKGNGEPTTTIEVTAMQREELKKKKTTDAEVLVMIQRGVSLAIFPKIMRAKTTNEAWENL